MPPRKSGASTVSAAEANGDVSTLSNATANATPSSSTQHAHPKPSRQSGGGSGRQDDGVGIDDLLLPRSLISRLSRGVLPPNTSLQKDALLALTRSATVFISYLAHHANEQSQLRHKKTLGVQDVMVALKEIEFGNVMELGAVGEDGRTGGRLEREVEVYEEIIGRKRRGYREKVKARESGGGGGAEGDAEIEDRGEPSNKKIRRMSAEEEEDEEERMLEQQLNGTSGQEVPSSAEKGKAKRKSQDHGGISVVVRNGKGKGTSKPDSTAREEVGHEDVEDLEADDGADDEEQDEDEEEDEQEEDDQDEDDDDEQDDEGGGDDDDEDDDGTDVDDSRQANGRGTGRVGLLPDGNVEIGSEDESD
ncbi:uncharacterized protein Z520_02311 [Fonsecaea multimorphosa CBS 102226]|uniref:DNA polymerase epsilon subunit D n=1 Tax=Fonsecaea multimorphosa CBS 102226 TaxID=1442371 RepID=A0A0D2K7W9_9EURO|nr:uncharacterized protein Z520_02311 [Fonsecaea multimorphosa CBS 102226]KIY02173.1 hypothetical protein Z520_02311 [Fonsecaea multimorphosa CBS 102226]OAL29366.1 hypothetical protein AYO22_02260 [Fonsecaea multimorphosa]